MSAFIFGWVEAQKTVGISFMRIWSKVDRCHYLRHVIIVVR
jgi:hypothetical protein